MKSAVILVIPLLAYCAQQEEKAAVTAAVSEDAVFHLDDGAADGSVQYDRRPQTLTLVKPRYQMDVILGRVQGTVTVEILIDAKGEVARARVPKPVAPELDAAAVEAVRQWRFVPAVRNGVPVQAVVRVPVEFRTQ